MINKLLQVFTKEYKQETEYESFMKSNQYKFRLNAGTEDEDTIINRMRRKAE
jgi:hypothetical protein